MDYEIRPPRPEEAPAWEKLRLVSWREAYSETFNPHMFKVQEEQLSARAQGFADWLASTGGIAQDVQAQLGQKRRALVAARTDGESSMLTGQRADGRQASSDISPLLGIAFASQMPTEPQRLEMLYLLPQAFGTGIAQALMNQILEPGPAEVEVLTANARAIRFYEKEGFSISRAEEFAGRKSYIMTRKTL